MTNRTDNEAPHGLSMTQIFHAIGLSRIVLICGLVFLHYVISVTLTIALGIGLGLSLARVYPRFRADERRQAARTSYG